MHSNTRLEFIVEAAPALIGYVDADERYRFNNSAYEEWFGCPARDVAGRHIRDVLGEAVYTVIEPHVRAALAGRRVTFDAALTYRDGLPRHVRATYVPDVDAAGRVHGFVAHVTDVSDLKRAELEQERTRRHTDELARVARTLSESLDVSEVAERIAESILPLFEAQSSVVRLLEPDGSLTCVAIAGKWLENFKPGYRLPPGVGLVGRAVAERRALWTSNVLDEPSIVLTSDFRRGLAGAGHHAVLAVPMQVKGEIIGAISTAHREIRTFTQADVDLLQAFADQAAIAMRNVQLLAREQAARAEAEEANRAKDQFLALLAHELRNPAGAHRRRRRPAAAARCAGRRHRAVGDDRGPPGQQPGPPARRPARRLAHHPRPDRPAPGHRAGRRCRGPCAGGHATAHRRAATGGGGGCCRRRPSTSTPIPRASSRSSSTCSTTRRSTRRRVAGSASPSSPRATRRCSASATPASGSPPTCCRVSSSCSCRAISPSPTPPVASASVSRWCSGWSSSTAAAWRRGARARGCGSEFTIRLPLGRGPVAGAAAMPSRRPAPTSVLIIEDNPDARQSLRAVLEYEGHRVDEAADGAEGLARAEATRPGVVLIDIGLPGLDGYEIARRIRARRGPEPILVAITGYGQADDRRRSREAGFDAHLTKPVAPEHLADVLAELAGRRAEGSPRG